MRPNDGEGFDRFITHGALLMEFILQSWQLHFLMLAGWINREQQEVIEYLRTENQVLKEKLSKKRKLLNDDQRRRLAVKGKILGSKRLQEAGTLFTPETILRWHRKLVAKKWDYAHKRKSVGRPRVTKLASVMVRSSVASGLVACCVTIIEPLRSSALDMVLLCCGTVTRRGVKLATNHDSRRSLASNSAQISSSWRA